MENSTQQPTFLFHDYETFGKSPSLAAPDFMKRSGEIGTQFGTLPRFHH
ncbi:hypothetical protein [Buttiauxella brennerae]|nr:hypothetical protein [Buttiauxella brennerae]